jgi:uncharacterized coiled-coil protein SlyX
MSRFERRHVPKKRSIMSFGGLTKKTQSQNNIITKKIEKKKINNHEIIKISNFSNVKNLNNNNNSSTIETKLLEMKIKHMEEKFENRILDLEIKVIEQGETIEKMNTFFDTLTKNLKTVTYDNFKKIQATRRLVLSNMSRKDREHVGIDDTFIETTTKKEFLDTIDGENIVEKRQTEVVIKKVGENQFGNETSNENEKVDKAAPTKGNGYFSKSEAFKSLNMTNQTVEQTLKKSNKASTEVSNEVKNEITNKVSSDEEKKKKPILRKRRRRNRVVLDINE